MTNNEAREIAQLHSSIWVEEFPEARGRGDSLPIMMLALAILVVLASCALVVMHEHMQDRITVAEREADAAAIAALSKCASAGFFKLGQ